MKLLIKMIDLLNQFFCEKAYFLIDFNMIN
jgi:hypothetical protein